MMTSVRLSFRSSSDSIRSQLGSEIPRCTNSWYNPAEMTNRTVPIRKMSMIATVSAIRDLAASDVTAPARMRSTMTAITRSRPKTWRVADAAKVPSTARMIRNRLVPRMSRITTNTSAAAPAHHKRSPATASRDCRRSDRRRRDALECRPDIIRIEVPEDQRGHDRHREADAGPGELEEREDSLEDRDPRDEHREEASPRLQRP